MTLAELLQLLGQSWARLLFFPGGLTALAVMWLLEMRAPPLVRGHISTPSVLALTALVAPWLALALLPLPPIATLPRGIDVIALLALLEWPLWQAVALDLQMGEAAARRRGVLRAAAALNAYPVLVLATLVVFTTSGTFEIGGLLRAPEEVPLVDAVRFWGGVVALMLALPGLIGVGAFAAGAERRGAIRIGLRLRAYGLVALTALPWMSLARGADGEPIVWLLLVPPLVIAVLLWLFARATSGRPPHGWVRVYLLFSILLLVGLLLAAGAAFP